MPLLYGGWPVMGGCVNSKQSSAELCPGRGTEHFLSGCSGPLVGVLKHLAYSCLGPLVGVLKICGQMCGPLAGVPNICYPDVCDP